MRLRSLCPAVGLATTTIAALLAFAPTASAAPPRPTPVDGIRSGTPTQAALDRATPRERLGLSVRCVEVAADSTYCLHLGWQPTGAFDRAAVDRMLDRAATEPATVSETGAATLRAEVERRAREPYADRQAAEVAEIDAATAAARALHREREATAAYARNRGTAGLARPCSDDGEGSCPDEAALLTDAQYRKQETSYYCSAASAQMAALAGEEKISQKKLYDGIKGEMPKLVKTLNTKVPAYADDPYTMRNDFTGWRDFYDTVGYATLSTRRPVVASVNLYKKYFGYISKDSTSGHFQVARGYDTDGKYGHISIFEPYNEADWRRGGNETGGEHRISSNTYYAAVKSRYNRAAV